MARAVLTRPTEHWFLGSRRTGEVHDLGKEVQGCSIDQIVQSLQAVVFVPDSHEQASVEGYTSCPRCVANRI